MEKYRINYESIPHGVISWRHDGSDSVYCEAGEEVRITWQPSAGWGLSEAHYTDANGNKVDIDTKEMAFIMPESDITIGGTFKRFIIDDWEGYEGGGGGGGTKDYNGLDHKPSINGVTLQGNKTGKELKLDDVEYVSTFDGVTGDVDVLYYLDTEYDTYKVGFYRFIEAHGGEPAKFVRIDLPSVKYVSTFNGVAGSTEALYYLDTAYDTYKVGFYRFIEAHGGEPAKFVRINPSPIKYVSTFNGVVGNTEDLYYLDTAYDNYEVGFYRFVEATTTEPEKFVILNKQRFKYVSTFTGEVGDINRLYYLDTAYDDFKKGFYRYNGTAFVNINPKEFFYVSTFTGVEGDDEALYFLDTNYDEYTVGFYRYVEVEESGVTVGKFIHTGNPHQLQVTYAKLKEMRDNSMLIAGMQYRITDFVTTSVQANTRSANHPFDIIVKADSENTLNENAYAALHEGDTYFANSDLSAWSLKYCLDNDTSRFAWADATNGKGVIFYMKDEWKNECAYDFKNVQYKGSRNPIAGIEADLYYFTFTRNNSNSQSAIYDNSIVAEGECRLNSMAMYYTNGKQQLNFNILRSTDEAPVCVLNRFGLSCYNNMANTRFLCNSFAYNCYNNSFGSNVYFMKFGSNCYKNEVDTGALRISIGNGCYNNIFSKQVANVKFGDVCYNNKIRENSKNVSFSFSCYSNTIGQNSETVSFEANCYSNLIQSFSKFITLGHDCSNNTFGYLAGHNGDFSTITFGSSCKYNKVRNAIKKLDVGNNVNYCDITAVTGNQGTISNLVVLDDTKGKSSTSLLKIEFQKNKSYTQYAGLKSDGKLRIWNIADIGDVEKDNIIDVRVLPTTDIDTDAFYRITTTHYYHNDTELTYQPQGYKSLNTEALVADENGLTAIEGETSTTTPWAEVTDAMIATLVSGSLVATCDFGEAGFFKTDADEYDYAGNFSTTDTYALWHNATGDPADWVAVDTAGDLVTDGETTEGVNGELRANAIIDVDVFPTTNIKEATFYRKREDHFIDASDNEVVALAKYICDGEHIEASAVGLIDKSTGVPTPWAALTDAIVDGYVASGYCRVTEAIGNTPNSLYFIKTGTDAYAHLMCIQTKSLYHHEDGAWKLVSEDSAPDGVTIETVNGKLQANAVIDVTALPTTGIKAKAIYRMYVHRYLEDGEPLADAPTGYAARGTLAVVDENGITDTGVSPAVLYPWDEIDDDRMEWLINKRLMREVPAADLMTESTCFRTASNHYVYKDHVTEEGVYELYHNPTATAGEFVKVGGGAASVKTDNVTTQEVDGKLQANAIIEVQTLPATGYKQNSLYRMLDTATQTFKRYYYNSSADPLPETPTFYKGDGEHLVFGADGYTLNGSQGSYSSITQITISVWTNNGWVSETADFSEAGMFRMPGSLAVYDSTTKLTEEDYVVTAEMDKVFKRVQGGWECISYIQLEKEQYDILSEAQKNDGTLYIVNDEED